MRTIAIDPVTRIEGHARVMLEVDDAGAVTDARMVVNELRGFERLLVGMEVDRMPLVTARICGVCPSAHHLAAARALDALAGVEPPPAAKILRELLYMGHVIHSHALALYVLEGPDLVLGLDADPGIRNVVGVVGAVPEIAKQALRLRSLGQRINELIGGRGVHPVTAVAGGITFVLDAEKHRRLSEWVDEALTLVSALAPVTKDLLLRMVDASPEILAWKLSTAYLGTVSAGSLRFCDGELRMRGAEGDVISEFSARDYDAHLVESVLDWSYMKPVFFRHGGEDVTYRVGPLARINAGDDVDTKLASAELSSFRRTFPRPCHHTVMQIWSRLIELVHAVERAGVLLADPAIFGEARVPVTFRRGRGVGHVEAPRGTLFHDYEIDDEGIVRSANLIVATQQNYAAINRTLRQVADVRVADQGDQRLLDTIEFAIRCHDPCLSCATHAIGQMPLVVEIVRAGKLLRAVGRFA